MSWQQDLAQLVERRIGIRLRTGSTTGFLERFVSGRVEALGLGSAEAYVALAGGEQGHGDEVARLVAVVTNGQTSFFRDNDQFESIGLVLRQLAAELKRPLTIWSAACSTGEEAYSVAILAAELGLDVRVLGTDINPGFLKVAERGAYGDWSLRALPQALRERYFEHSAQTGYIVRDAVRSRVRFLQHNLVDALPPGSDGARGAWDVILCRNVFIYYRRPLVSAIVKRMLGVLDVSGWLFVGVAETLRDLDVPARAVAVGSRHGYRPGAAEPEAVGQRLVVERGANAPTWVPFIEEAAPEPHRETHVTYTGVLSLLRRHELEAGRRDLARLLEQGDQDAIAWMTLGNLHLTAHEFDLALDAYGRAQTIEPLSAEVHHLQGVAYRKMADLPRAEQALRRAQFLDDRFWPAAFLLAGVYERQGREDAARRELQHALEILGTERNASLFRSYVQEMESLDLNEEEVRRACTQRLRGANAPPSKRSRSKL